MSAESPCRNICALDAAAEFCTACLRSLDEIARWSAMTEAERRAVLDDLPRRQPR